MHNKGSSSRESCHRLTWWAGCFRVISSKAWSSGAFPRAESAFAPCQGNPALSLGSCDVTPEANGAAQKTA
jgi:hypothetical protein